MRDIVITKLEIDSIPVTAAAYIRDGVLSLLKIERDDAASADRLIPGTIMIGKVESVQKNIRGAFLRLGEENCYLEGAHLKAGEELTVQVKKTAAGVKQPTVSRTLEIPGQYCVVSYAEGMPGGVDISKKLSQGQRETLGGWKKDIDPQGFQIILRTNAGHADKATVLTEVNGLIGLLKEILAKAPTRTCHSVLYRPMPFYAELFSEIRGEEPDRIVTDQEEIYQYLKEEAQRMPYRFPADTAEKLTLYRDESFPLASCYNMRRDIGRLLSDKVWLKSGAYLVIEKTEAFYSIDVNTGKCIRGKIPEETYRQVNKEAAAEAARQIRLRNLSGMILIDFINMKKAEHCEELLHVMRDELREDPLRAEAVDITKLGIMEITRARRNLPISDIIFKESV